MYDAAKDEGEKFHKLQVLGMNDDLWDRFCGLCTALWIGCVVGGASGIPDMPLKNRIS